jgi:hypothetical protein
MVIQWSEEDNCFLVGFPDFPEQQWRTHGDTYQEAVTNRLVRNINLGEKKMVGAFVLS